MRETGALHARWSVITARNKTWAAAGQTWTAVTAENDLSKGSGPKTGLEIIDKGFRPACNRDNTRGRSNRSTRPIWVCFSEV